MRLYGRRVPFKGFLHALWRNFNDDEVLNIAGAVAFFGLSSIFPFLLFLLSLASQFIDVETADQLVAALARVAPAAVVQILGNSIRALGERNSSGVLAASLAVALFTASGVVLSLSSALNRAYGVKKPRPMWLSYVVAIITVIAAALLVMVAMLLTMATPLVTRLVGPRTGAAILALRFPFAGLVMMLVWALTYHFLPNEKRPFRFFTAGAVIGVLAWMLVSWAFSIYVGNSNRYTLTYGALGGVIIMLTWLWLSVVVLLIGAEINALVECPPCRPIPGAEPFVAQQGRSSPAPRPQQPAADAAPPLPQREQPAPTAKARRSPAARPPLQVVVAFVAGILAGRRLAR